MNYSDSLDIKYYLTITVIFSGEYGGPLGALKAKDIKAFTVLARPDRILLHNFYELIWHIKTGFPDASVIPNLPGLGLGLQKHKGNPPFLCVTPSRA